MQEAIIEEAETDPTKRYAPLPKVSIRHIYGHLGGTYKQGHI